MNRNQDVSVPKSGIGHPSSIGARLKLFSELIPDRVAVEAGQGKATFSELDAWSDAVMTRLRSFGIGPEKLVAVLLERSVDMLVVLLGILKAGGAYMPLDYSSTPVTRLRTMLEDAAPSLLITGTEFRNIVQQLPSSIPIHFHEHINFTPDSSSSFNESEASEDQLAYVIYTSGSTGSPKGVEILHGGLTNFLAHMSEELNFGSGDTMLAIASLSFDVSIFELLLPPFCGGRVVILSREEASDGKLLRQAIERYKPSLLLGTPATWQLLIDAGWQGNGQLRAVSGGERILPSLVETLLPKVKELWNHYGPTETTIAATTYRIERVEEYFPIGKAISGIRLHVLDSEGNPVLNGEPGELYISGRCLARGYRGKPALTEDRFRGICGGALRAYQTGDIVRYIDAENMEFLYRTDNQIKVRGYRIELGEIETALSHHPGVKECAVVAQDRGAIDKSIAAFIVPERNANVSFEALRAFVGESLASYMVPDRFFLLEALPRSVNGKLDRWRLQGMQAGRMLLAEGEDSAPADDLEKQLLAVWRSIPGFETISVTDSFFDHGGNSLLGSKLLLSVNNRFRVSLPLSTLLQAPTVRKFAVVLRKGDFAELWSPLVPIRQDGWKPALFCVHGIGGNVLGFERLAAHMKSDQPVYGLQAVRPDGQPTPGTVEDIARSYLRCILDVQPAGTYLLAGYSAGGIIALEIARLLTLLGKHVGLLILLDAANYARDTKTRPAGRDPSPLIRIFRRFYKFWTMPAAERGPALKKNIEYYSWLWAVMLRISIHLRLKKYGIHLPRPRRIPDGIALAIREFQPSPFDGRAVLFRAHAGDGSEDDDPTMGWSGLINDLSVEWCSGDHFGMFEEPHVQFLASAISSRLDQAIDNANGISDLEAASRTTTPMR